MAGGDQQLEGGARKMDGSDSTKAGRGQEFLAGWIDEHRGMYDRATAHPFILNIRDGTIDVSSFKRWLEQDYIFVRAFVPFVASLLLKASRESNEEEDVEIILGGMAALHEELRWFKTEAAKWDLLLGNIIPLSATQEYCRFLKGLEEPEVNYAMAMVAFWTMETVYQESFSLCLGTGSKTPPELLETCLRWGSPSFKIYCASLRRIAERCLDKAQDISLLNAEAVFQRVLQLEVNFWDMSGLNC
ncbi:heme oxygenase-like, multi-helical [Wolffia australiana]